MTLAAAQAAPAARTVAVEAVALDLDGTLLHTAPDLALAANLMLSDLERPLVAETVVMTYVGNGAARLIKRLLTGEMDGEPEAHLFEQAQALFYRHYAEGLDVHTRLYPGVVEALQSLRQAGFRLACITNKPQQFTLPLLRTTGLHRYFDLVIGGDVLARKKPDPLPLLHVCRQFAIVPQEMAMVGDSIADVEAARNAGCYAIYVPYGYNRGMSGEAVGADAVIASLMDVTKIIHKKERANA
ncbi:MAG TPA: phosphoglycolate phosphatase [Methylophilaceae bacterium]|nr:phosphoglycolate phosphatase [Methylophilaceae bacterium]